MTISLVTVPYRYDEYDQGLGKGPAALLDAGLGKRLAAIGITLDEPVIARLPDDEKVSGPVSVNIGRLGGYTAAAVADGLANEGRALVLAGDDTAAIGVISGIQQARGAGTSIGLVWLDAHADFNTPETSYSGILAGMPVAILAGLAGPIWRENARLQATIPTDRILIAGVREVDEKESMLLRSTDVRCVSATDVGTAGAFKQAVDRLAQSVETIALHVDLDVLDPMLVPSSSTPSRNGLTVQHVARMIAAVVGTGKASVVTIASLNPGAGARGERSIESTISLLEQSLGSWDA